MSYSSDEDTSGLSGMPKANEFWQYTVQDWITDNENELSLLFAELKTTFVSLGATILSEITFTQFCLIVSKIVTIPELGMRVSSR